MNMTPDDVIRATDANKLEADTIRKFFALTKHGCKFCDLVVRKDGREYRFEADWLVRLGRQR